MRTVIVLDAQGVARPPYTGPAVTPVVTRRCWLCHGTGYIETGLQEFMNIGHACRCAACAGSGRITSEVTL